MEKPLRVLIVEDLEDDYELIVRELRRNGYAPVAARVDTPETLDAALDQQSWDIVISDYAMPKFSGLEVLKQVQRKGLDLPLIIVSGSIGEDIAVAAMKSGAYDYLMKSNLVRLVPAIERELKEAEVRRERRRAEEQVRHLAYYDPLTGLPNRILFHEQVQRAVEAGVREHRPAALLLMDLERFREVNDTLGHQHGDQLLKQVGLRLRSALFQPDLVARLGGDEFGILLPHLASADDVAVVCKKILAILEAPISIDGIPIVVEASIGVALAPGHASDADSLMQRADVAMYRAKQTGGGFEVYASEYDPHNPRRLALMAELREAIDHDQLLLHYQPQIDIQTGRAVAAEALVRWQHPRDGLLMPDRFIATAERTALIKPLTHWVLAMALHQCVAYRRKNKRLRVCVNLSVRSLHDPHLLEQVADLLGAAGAEPGLLELEITESAIMLDPSRAFETLAALHRMGVLLSIDDFGTGFTSLGYLKKLPVDEVKIDKSFVMDMLTNESDATIVRSVIDLCHTIGLKVVAEGVESQAILDRLASLGCDYAQGYYICRPGPAAQFEAWLDQQGQG